MNYKKSEIKDKKLVISNGFTLVELLVVIAIIAILFAVILIAINPAQRFKDSRNARRLSDVQSIAGATTTYTTDKRGTPPADIPDGQCIGTKLADDFSTQVPQGVSWWEFNDLVSPLSDSLTGGNPATASNIAYSAPGRFGSAITLNGINSSIVVGDNANISPNVISLELWMKLANDFSQKNGSPVGLIDKGNYRLGLDGSTGSLFFEIDQNNMPSEPLYSTMVPNPPVGIIGHGIYAMAAYKNRLYFGYGGGAGEGKIYSTDGGADSLPVNSYPETPYNILSMSVFDGKLFVGQGGISYGDGKIYSFDGLNWKMEYNTNKWEVRALEARNGKLYAGAGGDIDSAEVYEYDGVLWRPLGLSSQNRRVRSLEFYKGTLYVGTGGHSSNQAKILSWNGSVWNTILSSAAYSDAYSLKTYDDTLYIGVVDNGGSGNPGRVYKYDGSSVNFSDSIATTLGVYSLEVYNGRLFAGYGGALPAAKVIRVLDYIGAPTNNYVWSSYTNMPSAPSNNSEAITSFGEFDGKFYIGQYDDATVGATEIVQTGDSRILYSKKQKWNANQWYHIAVTPDNGGYIYSMYINGALDNASTASFGTSIEGTNNYLHLGVDHSNGVLNGSIDNVIIYNTPRSSSEIASHAGCYNLGQYLAPEYMGSLPIDPSSTVTDGTDTGYFISKDTGGVITITAPLTETTSSVPEIIKASR